MKPLENSSFTEERHGASGSSCQFGLGLDCNLAEENTLKVHRRAHIGYRLYTPLEPQALAAVRRNIKNRRA
jgi:hypothetical protein